MLIYDGASASAARLAHRLRPLVPLGTPVVADVDLPDAGTLELAEGAVTNTIVWVAVDGTPYRRRAALARALIAAGGSSAAWGWLMRIPVLGPLAVVGWAVVAPGAADPAGGPVTR